MNRSATGRRAAPGIRSRPRRDLITAIAVATVAGGVAWVAAQTGLQGIVAIGALLLIVTGMFVSSRPVLLVQAGTVLSIALLLHKSFGPLADDIHSGALGFTISTLNLALVVLYLMWWVEGSMITDISAALGRPVFYVPLVGLGASAVSLLVARNVYLGFAELFRLLWFYLLFVYFGVRIRKRTEIWVAVWALAVIALIELVAVVLQWRTGGVLGLEFLGVPTELGERVFDAGSVGRPFGTIVHPVFMGATMATLGLLAASFALHLESRRSRLIAIGFVVVCFTPIVIANARAAMVAFALAAVGLVIIVGRLGRVAWRTVWRISGVALLVILPFVPRMATEVRDVFFSDRAGFELRSRVELNEVALEMFDDSPLLGVGLNNFEQALDHYDRYGLIFGGNPVHNLFLLHAAETGLLGVLGMLLIGGLLAWEATRSARSKDPLVATLGAGLASVLVFYLFEEQLGFSLRQEVPLSVFWMLAGLTVAAQGMANETPAPPVRRHLKPREFRGGLLGVVAPILAIALMLAAPVSATNPGEVYAPVMCEPSYLQDAADPTPTTTAPPSTAPAEDSGSMDGVKLDAVPTPSSTVEEGSSSVSPGTDITTPSDGTGDVPVPSTSVPEAAEDATAPTPVGVASHPECTPFRYPLVFPIASEVPSPVMESATGAIISAPPGVPVVAAAKGVVSSYDGAAGLVVRHSDGWTTRYHGTLASPFVAAPGVEVGSEVVAGDLLGWTGGGVDSVVILFDLSDPTGRLVDPMESLDSAVRIEELVRSAIQPPPETVATERPLSTDGLRVVFSARDRGSGEWGIYTANGDGSDLVKLTHTRGVRFNWPSWALGGQKIIYTARDGPPGSAETIYWMNPDGSGVQALTTNDWRNAQPQVSSDGKMVVFSSAWDEYPYFGLYLLDLETLEVTNLSAREGPLGATDSDPKWTPAGALVYARSVGTNLQSVPTQIWSMTVGADGSARQLIADQYNNVDPEVSPDGRSIAYSSFRGVGSPARDLTDAEVLGAILSGADERALFEIAGWHLVVRDLTSGQEKELTAAGPCDQRPIDEPCDPSEGSAFVANWAPNGDAIGYVTALSQSRVCICVVDPRTGASWPAVDSFQLDIDWFDWVSPGAIPQGAVTSPGSKRSSASVLVVGNGKLLVSTPDLWGYRELQLPAGLEPLTARWSPDRSQVVFSARTSYDTSAFQPSPAAPQGQSRHVHFVLEDLLPLLDPPIEREDAASEQVFILDVSSGTVRQLTTPWTEDYMDALRDFEARGNTDPVFTPNGQSVVFTNVSTRTSELFLLRLDLGTGLVYNLTNATAGAVAVADWDADISPDGRRVAFATTEGANNQIAVMNLLDGKEIAKVTNDDYINMSPAWSPDGQRLAYISYRGTELFEMPDEVPVDDGAIPVDGWFLVVLDLRTGTESLLTDGRGTPAFSPAWSGDGEDVLFVSLGGAGKPDLFRVHSRGDGPARPIQTTLLTGEVTVDWR